MMGGNALEVAPSRCCLILLDGRLRHFKGEVVLGYAVECSCLYVWRYFALTYDASNALATFKCSAVFIVTCLIAYVFQTGR